MAYTPKNWKDLPDETTPIQASDLNHIEQGIGDLDTSVSNLNTSVSNLNTSIGDLNTLNTTNKSSIVGAINEVNTKNIMTLGLNEDYISTSSSTTKIPLTKTMNSVGDKLTYYDNGIKIGSGISKVKVSANIMEITNSACLCGGTIAKNGITLADSVSVGFQYIPTSGQLFNSSFTSIVVDVKENDILYLTAYSQDSNSKTIVAYSGRATYLTVEVV